eukprot:c8742_g1_i2.p1 GENE.c8742_g1_i2~~c8742_g1_i2.p1  ORF type:complete len:363 (+),score=97.19 c8742_g1_i2:22-1089(+)
MVLALDLNENDFIRIDGQVVELTDKYPANPDEVGADGVIKLKLVFSDQHGNERFAIVNLSDEIEVVPPDAPVRRPGVSAGHTSEKWVKTEYQKSPEAREKIRERLLQNVFFSHLDDQEVAELIDVVFPKEFAPGDVLMQEGDVGDLFYIIDEGFADIYVGQQRVRECSVGDSFGELALMYNAPRNATVKARTDLKCWCMDRDSFSHMIMGASIKKQQRHLSFIDSVNIFSTLSHAEKMKLADALIPRKVQAGTLIVKQGDVGDMFYIVEDGAVIVEQETPEGTIETVNEKSAGDYFGEIALMSSLPRSANVKAVSDCVILTVARKEFVDLLGPMLPLLQRNVQLYKTYVDYTGII